MVTKSFIIVHEGCRPVNMLQVRSVGVIRCYIRFYFDDSDSEYWTFDTPEECEAVYKRIMSSFAVSM